MTISWFEMERHIVLKIKQTKIEEEEGGRNREVERDNEMVIRGRAK